MRPDDFEDRLRHALHARAGDVTPDPATWVRVRDRIEGGQRSRWVVALTAVAPLVVAALAAVAVFGLLDRDRDDVELAPGPTPSPSASASEEAAAGSAALVLAAEPGIVLADDDGRPLATLYQQDAPVTVARARPAGIADDPAVAFLEEAEPCLGQVGVAVEGGTARLSTGAICPTAPAWSPDGAFVAFLERGSDGGQRVTIRPWDDTTNRPYSSVLARAIEGDRGLSDLRLHDWVWTGAASETARGYLILTATDADGTVGAYRLPVARPRPLDESIVVGALEPMDEGIVAYADGGPGSPEYVITVEEGRPTLTWSDDGETGALALPADVLGDGATGTWVSAAGDAVVFGDGVDDAWRVQRRGSDWTRPERLPGAVRFADLVAGPQAPPMVEPAPAPTPSPSPSPRPSASPSPSPSPRPSASPSASPSPPAVPTAVTRTRDALLQAAAARSYDQLAALLPADGEFTSSYGGMTDHIAFYRMEEANGIDVFAKLATVLEAEPQLLTRWTWLPADELDYRVGIDPDGIWRFFVAGD